MQTADELFAGLFAALRANVKPGEASTATLTTHDGAVFAVSLDRTHIMMDVSVNVTDIKPAVKA
jgi:hypothetical protein